MFTAKKKKKRKTDVLDFLGWVIKSICFFGYKGFFCKHCSAVKMQHIIHQQGQVQEQPQNLRPSSRENAKI